VNVAVCKWDTPFAKGHAVQTGTQKTTNPPHADASAQNAEAAPVDRAHLARYTLGDAALEREILALFLAHVPLAIESLKFASTDKEWREAAHTLKGSCRAVGAWRLGDLGLEAERLGGLGDRAACRAIIARIEEAAIEVEAYVAALFAGKTAEAPARPDSA
jgi:HPt (histidine-containing phosphotransfer) domain-containing protein